jgi:hypothetical protein
MQEMAGQSPRYNPAVRAATEQAVEDRTQLVNRRATDDRQAELNLEAAQRAFDLPGNMTDKDRFAVEGTLRDDFTNAFMDVDDTITAYQKMDAALNGGSNAAKLAAVMSFARILDPGSVVRTEEGRAVSNAAAGSIGNRFIQMYEDAKGGGFTEEAKGELRTVMDDITRPQMNRGLDLVTNYQGIVDRNPALDIENILANKTSALELVKKALTRTVTYQP